MSLMICPKAKDGSCKYKADCPDSIEHECNSACGATGYFFKQGKRYDCPACIPVEPEQPTPTMPLIESPENPYPEDIFPMQIWDYAEAVPDEEQRTAISGCVGRYVWNVCCEDWQKLIAEWLPAHDSEVESKAVKEFAEKVDEQLLDIMLKLGINPIHREKIIAHIRAVAEKDSGGR